MGLAADAADLFLFDFPSLAHEDHLRRPCQHSLALVLALLVLVLALALLLALALALALVLVPALAHEF